MSEYEVDRGALRRCGLTGADLAAILRQHGHQGPHDVHLAIFEVKGAVSVLPRTPPPTRGIVEETARRKMAAGTRSPPSNGKP